jgi:hypothetical protein
VWLRSFLVNVMRWNLKLATRGLPGVECRRSFSFVPLFGWREGEGQELVWSWWVRIHTRVCVLLERNRRLQSVIQAAMRNCVIVLF